MSAIEKQEIIRLVDRSELGVNKTLKELGIHKSTFYHWYRAYLEKGADGLSAKCVTRQQWNTIPEEQRQLVVEVALDHPVLSPRELAVKITDEQRIFISQVKRVPHLKSTRAGHPASAHPAFSSK